MHLLWNTWAGFGWSRREDIEVLLGRGSVRLQQGALEGALADASRALAVQPGNADAHSLRADVLMAKGQRAAALAAYREALARAAPGWPRAPAVQQRVASLARGR